MSIKKILSTTVLCLSPLYAAQANDQIRVVGSSTVYPFTTVVAESFGRTTDFATPIVESTGTGGGFKLFCSGIGDAPDVNNASRAIKQSERDLCAQNGIKDITEIKIGYDGIVVANSVKAPVYKLSSHDIFLALAKQVPVNGTLVDNPYKTWKEVNAALPDTKIEVYGPPPTSGTRDAFVELLMEKECEKIDAYSDHYQDTHARKKACHMLREDGSYIEAGENDNLIVQKLTSNPEALGIFGYSFLEQNGQTIHGSYVDDVAPTFENIADGSYAISRPLFVYIKNAHFNLTKGLTAFTKEFISDKATGEEGYLAERGLIPLPEEEHQTIKDHVMQALPSVQ